MIILGVSCYYHDSSACIVKDGVIVAAIAEERLSRLKHDNGFPEKSIKYCLDFLGIAINEVDCVSFYEKPVLKFDRVIEQHLKFFPRSLQTFIDTFPSWIKVKLNLKKTLREEFSYVGEIHYVEHHLAHAAASYLSSSFQEAAILTIDGVGEWATTTKGFGSKNRITLTDQINFPHSIGLLYSTMTAYLGFAVNSDEYKVMGLAAYGDSTKKYAKIKKLVRINPDGSFILNMKYFSYEYNDRMPSEMLCKLLGGPVRASDSKITRRHENIAAATQRLLEEIVFNILNKMYKDKPCSNLVISGGVALNSVLNGKISSNTPYTNIFITPDPGDGGGSLGAALYSYSIKTNKRVVNGDSVYLGPSYSDEQIIRSLIKFEGAIRYQKLSRKDLIFETVKLIRKNMVIGWFQGRMEWGPRALGGRSILAQATSVKMRDLVNEKVKKREMFRPFAPVILREKTDEYFIADKNLSKSANYMLFVYPVKKTKQKIIPAVVHVDGTGRLQTIVREDNVLYFDLLNEYYKQTGIPVLLNTSFNVRGEPIVCTPLDALNCFWGTEIDYLIIGNYIVKKNDKGDS